MAYGTSDGVLLWLGRTAADSVGFFTASNITAAIAAADVLVDSINTNADAANKTQASNMIAADILFNRFALAQTNGLSSTTPTQGQPGQTLSARNVVSEAAKTILKSTKSKIAYSTVTARDEDDNYLG